MIVRILANVGVHAVLRFHCCTVLLTTGAVPKMGANASSCVGVRMTAMQMAECKNDDSVFGLHFLFF